MSDDTATPQYDTATPQNDEDGESAFAPPKDERNDSDAEAPVGDMTEEGQTEVGPYPSLSRVDNMAQADLEQVANDRTDDPPSQGN